MMGHAHRAPASRGVFLDARTLDRGDLDRSPLDDALPDLTWHERSTDAERHERTRDAQVLITNKAAVDQALIAAAPRLELICVAATGTNNIDLAASRDAGVTVTNCHGYGTPSVVQHVFGLMIALANRWPDYAKAVRDGTWSRSPDFCLLDFPIRELAGKRLGIIGYGELGQAVATVGRAFGMEIAIALRPGTDECPAGRTPLPELLGTADVVTLHCPLTDATRGLIDQAALARMRRGSLLINTARGGIVDESALAEALRARHLGGAGVDVVSPEPPPPDHPLLAEDIPNLIVTPHCAWGSREARQRIIGQLAENITAYRAGRPIRVVGST